MDMLGTAGYYVGRGSDSAGAVLPYGLPNVINDSDIQNMIQTGIFFFGLAQPDPNRLYVVFVQPNTEVIGPGGNSVSNFAGYHGAFLGVNAFFQLTVFHYAVVTTPGGTVGNTYANGESYLSQFDEMTMVASHEIAEAVTDPDANFSTVGWYDDSKNQEIGDIVNGQSVRLNGYLVQKEVDQYDNPMFPTGLSFQGNNIGAVAGRQFTARLALGSDPLGTTSVSNVVAYIGWGDGGSSYGSVTQDAYGNFLVNGTHTYGGAGDYQVTVYLYDSTNLSLSPRFVFDNASVSYPSFGGLSLPPGGIGFLARSAATPQQALALAGTSLAVPPTSGTAPMAAASLSGPVATGAAGRPAVFAFDAAARDASRADGPDRRRDDAPAAGAVVHGGWARRLADALFAANPFDPLALALGG
jgi:hypothetical protein